MLCLHCCSGFSLVAASRGYSLIEVHGLLIVVAALVAEPGLWGLWAPVAVVQFPGSRAQAQSLWPMGLVAPWHVESSRIGDQTYVPCIGRQILYH